MKKLCYSLFILFTYLSFSQSHDNNKANYELAYKFSPKNLAKLVIQQPLILIGLKTEINFGINIKQLMVLNII